MNRTNLLRKCLILLCFNMHSLVALKFTILPSVGKLNTNSASLEWFTDENTKATVLYSTNRESLEEIAYSASTTKFHKLSLTGLLPNTVYYYKVRIKNEKGNTLYSAVSSFKTHIQIESIKPRFIQLPVVSQFESTQVQLEWKTNTPCQSIIYYGKTKKIFLKKELLIPQDNVKFTLENLEPSHVYYVKINIKNSFDQSLESSTFTFRTRSKDTISKPFVQETLQSYPLKHPPIVSFLSEKDVFLEISLAQPGKVHIIYGIDELKNTSESNALKENHIIPLRNLKSNSVYTYKIKISGKLLPETYQFKTLWRLP